MTIQDLLFILYLIGILGIFLYKLYNIVSLGKIYDLKVAIILFIGYFLAWLIGFVVFMLDPERLIYMFMFKIGTWLILLNVLFFIVELVFYLVSITEKAIMPYKPDNSAK